MVLHLLQDSSIRSLAPPLLLEITLVLFNSLHQGLLRCSLVFAGPDLKS